MSRLIYDLSTLTPILLNMFSALGIRCVQALEICDLSEKETKGSYSHLLRLIVVLPRSSFKPMMHTPTLITVLIVNLAHTASNEPYSKAGKMLIFPHESEVLVVTFQCFTFRCSSYYCFGVLLAFSCYLPETRRKLDFVV